MRYAQCSGGGEIECGNSYANVTTESNAKDRVKDKSKTVV
jgi:hypothetical protein